MQIWAKKHGRPPLGKQLGVHMCSCYQTPDGAAEGYLEVPRQLIVCVYRHTHTLIFYISFLFFIIRTWEEGIPTTMEEPWPSWALGLGTGLKLFASLSREHARFLKQQSLLHFPHSAEAGLGRASNKIIKSLSGWRWALNDRVI